MPDGSSSAAPVINPGPKTAKDLFRYPDPLAFSTFWLDRCFFAVMSVGSDARNQANLWNSYETAELNCPMGEEHLQPRLPPRFLARTNNSSTVGGEEG